MRSWILVGLVCLVAVLVIIKMNNDEVIYVLSDIDNKSYLVRDLPDSHRAANMLAKIKENMLLLTNHLVTYKDSSYVDHRDYITQLSKKMQTVEISESSDTSAYTSYSVNKGEQIIFCLRSKTNKNELHDINLVMYVALHEMSHVACPEYGHTNLFKKIFAFITSVAINQGIYNKIYFRDNPLEYCGLTISDSII